MTPRQQALLDQLAAVLARDGRVRAAWLHGSLGRGGGDAWSDIDLVAEVDEADRAACLADYAEGRAGLPSMVFASVLFGRLVTAVTADWDRFDLMFLSGAELERMDGAALQPLLGDRRPAPRAATPQADLDAGAAARLGPRALEFLRVLGLADVMVGRGEWLVGAQGIELLRGMLIEHFLDENGLDPAVRGGVKRLNPFLTAEQRVLLEGLHPPALGREALLAAQAGLARAFLPRARALADRLGVAWPEAFEAATRRHLAATLGLEI